MLLLLLCVAAAAASTVTLQVHGEQNVRVLAENEPVYVPAGTAPRVRICLVFGWLYEPDMQHTTRCVVATIDCLCYTWQNAQSGAQCVDIALVQNTTLTWYLLPLPNVTQLLAAAVLQYQILAGRWPAYSIHVRDLAASICH